MLRFGPTLVAVAALALGCQAPDDPGDQPQPPPGDGSRPPELCAPGTLPPDCSAPGVPAWTCPAGSLPGANGCDAPGVPAGGCGQGFVNDDGGGCQPVLPASACGAGQLAVPGDAACHAPAACGAGTWGDIPVDAATVYVDAAAAPGGDGSAAKPFTTIGAAVAKAMPGQLVAIAAGTYAEALVLDKPLKLVGRCPEQVAIDGGAAVAVAVGPGASGTELRALAIRGANIGIVVVHATATIASVWVDHTGWTGVNAELGADVTLEDSLVDGATAVGVRARGAKLAVVRTVVRGTRPIPDADAQGGDGVLADYYGSGPAALSVARSVVLDNAGNGLWGYRSPVTADATLISGSGASVKPGYGVLVSGATLSLTGTVVRLSAGGGVLFDGASGSLARTVVRDSAGDASALSYGVRVQPGMLTPTVAIDRSLVAGVRHRGIDVGRGTATVTRTIVRDVAIPAGATYGRGIVASTAITTLTLDGVLIERAAECGACAFGATLDVGHAALRSIARSTYSDGSGAGIYAGVYQGTPAKLTVHDVLSEKNANGGIVLGGANATVDAAWIRDIGYDGGLSLGIGALTDAATGTPNQLKVTRTTIERVRKLGLLHEGGTLAVEATIVRDVSPAPDDGSAGRGMEIASGQASLRGVLVERVAEAGIAALGSTVSLDGVAIHDVAPSPAHAGGVGLALELDLGRPLPCRATVHDVEVARAHVAGVAVVGCEADIDVAAVTGSQTIGADFGDGVSVVGAWDAATLVPVPTRATITNSRIGANARAGIAVFGAKAEVATTQLDCDPIPLAGERAGPFDYQFADLGGNACGCGADGTACQVLSSNLAPPPPLP